MTKSSAQSASRAPARISVVGRNVSAALTLFELRKRLPPDSKLSWLFTQRDQKWSQTTESNHHWVFHPTGHLISNEQPLSAKSFKLHRVPFYFDGYKRFEVGDDGLFPKAQAPEPILKRIAAVALWNDFTPDLWKRAKRGFSIPDSDWTQKKTWSDSFQKNWSPVLYHRKTLLDWLSTELQSKAVLVSKMEQGVLGIKVGSFGASHLAVMNVPFDAEAFDKMLWMGQGQDLQREHSTEKKTTQKSASAHQELVGEWQSYTAKVPLNTVSALPLFSVWIDEAKRGQLLLRSGRLASGCIRRIFCIPENEKEAQLIIQELHLLAEYNESFPAVNLIRKDAFLWKLCPHLQKTLVHWLKLPTTDDDVIYRRPDSNVDRFEKDIGVLPNKIVMPPEVLEATLQFWKIK